MSADIKIVNVQARNRIETWLAWGMSVLSLILVLLLQWVLALPHLRPLDIETSGNSPFAFLGGLAFSIVGALIVSSNPRHPIGWIYCTSGLMVGATAFTTGYAQYDTVVPGILPAAGLASAISDISFVTGFMLPITFGLLLFPDGQLPSRRWRPVAWLTALGFLLSFVGFPFLILIPSVFASAVSLIMRWRRAAGDEREQLKWVGAAAVALIGILVVDLGISLVNPTLSDAGLGFLLATLAFALMPVAVGIAILKYRLYEIDLLINRTLVYVPLTAILAGTFAASITLTQKLFIMFTGQSSEAATVLTTLIVVAVFEPVKTQLQHLVDKRFKTPSPKFGAFGEELRTFVELHDPVQLTNRLLSEAVARLDASCGAVYLTMDGQQRLVHRYGVWSGEARLRIPMVADGTAVGELALGTRRHGGEYTVQDREALGRIADLAARTLALAGGAEVSPG